MSDPTQWLQMLSQGEPGAADELFPLIYSELHRLARRAMRDQAAGATLQTTALVHEAWIRLAGHLEEGSDEVLHFRALAAAAMRSVLVDHARSKSAAKRGGDLARVTLGDADAPEGGSDVLLDLHAALERLSDLDPQLARIAELRCFSGLEHKDISRLLGVSIKTAERRWKAARAWLQNELRAEDEEPA